MTQELPSIHPNQQQTVGDINAQGDDNIIDVIQANYATVTVNKTFNRTEIFQILVDVIKTQKFKESSPYRGLRRFEAVDKDLFFGRDQFLTGLVNELNQTNFILLLGASGSGKSSVVRAGLIPWLSREWGSKFTDLTFTPNLEPFNSFYQRLHDRYQQAEAQFVLEGKVDTLTQTVKRLQPPKDFWFIFIDQFEELFTLSQADQRDRFIGSLVQMIHTLETDQNRLVKVIATMRADFLDRLSPYPELIKATNQHRPMIAEMQLDELRLAIEQPAAHHGVVFETGLVEAIIKDVQGQAGYLPLLQYTLNLLWETEVQTGSIRDRTLNVSNYRSLGGVRGALQKHVEEVYQRLSKAEQLAAQRIFLKLIGIGGDAESGTEWKPVRRRASRTEFDAPLEQRVADRLINENLLVSSRETQSQASIVEIAHEVLLTSWTTLSVWIRENRQVIALRNRLNDDVARWQAKKQDDELWVGSKLEQALELEKNSTFNQVLGGFSSAANQFIDVSKRRRDRQRRRVITVLTGFSAVTLTVALIAFQQYLDATRQKISAELKAMSAKSELLASEGNQFDALITSLEAARRLDQMSLIAADPDTRSIVTVSLQQILGEVKEYNRLEGHTYSVTSVSFSPDGQLIASASQDKTVKLWDRNGKFLKNLAGHNDVVNGVSFSKNGTIASASGDGTIKLWTQDGLPLTSFPPQNPAKFSSISFSPTIDQIVTASNDGKITLWDRKGNPRKWAGLSRCDDVFCIKSVVFNSKGNLIASAGNDGTITLWNLAGKVQKKWNYKDVINSVSFSPDGTLIAGANNGKLILWSLRSQPKIWVAHSSSVNSVSFSQNGQTIASGGSDGKIKLWDQNGNLLTIFQGHTDSVNSVSFSPDGQTLASASADNTIKLWRIHNRGINRFDIPGDSTEQTPIISPDGTLLASLSKDSTAIHIWDVREPKQMKSFSRPNYRMTRIGWSSDRQWIASIGEEDTKDSSGNRTSHNTLNLWDQKGAIQKSFAFDDATQCAVWNVTSPRFSPNKKWLAFGCDNGAVTLWDLEKNTLKSIHTSEKSVEDVAFSPNGQIIASTSDDFTIKLWSLDGKLLQAFEQKHSDRINRVSFSRDGQKIASSSDDATIRIWNLDGALLSTLKGHKGKVNSASFSPDGNLIASTGIDQTVKLWSRYGTLLTTLREHRASVSDAYFDTNGTTLVSVDQSNSVIFWNLNLKKLIQQSCNWLQIYFTNNLDIEQRRKKLCPSL